MSKLTFVTEEFNCHLECGRCPYVKAKNGEQMCAFVFPNPNTMRGLRQLYESKSPLPFADEFNPTQLEVENWHIEVIRHARALFGITTPVQKSRSLMLRTQWTLERGHSNVWDAAYPANGNLNYGPCPSGASHCGASFVPSAADQEPYLNPGEPSISLTPPGGSEGSSSVNTNIPWSIKLARVLSGWLCNEGIGGHYGPILGRATYGSAFGVDPAVSNGSNSVYIQKMGGSLTPVC